MNKRVRSLLVLLVVAGIGYGIYAYLNRPPTSLVLTGIVTTNDVIVSPQIAGQIGKMLVAEGDQVKKDQLLATIAPDELKADSAYYTHNAEGLTSQVRESEAALRFQQQQLTDQVAQAQATLASTEAQTKAAAADLEDARLKFQRSQDLSKAGLLP